MSKLHILHAEDNKEVFESCKASIMEAFDRSTMPNPDIKNVAYCSAIFWEIDELQRQNEVYDILLLDLELIDKSEYNGLVAVEKIRSISPHTKIVVLSGNIYDERYHVTLQEYKKAGKIEGFFETGSHDEWCSELIRLATTQRIGILHFSDMHISDRAHSRQILAGFTEKFLEQDEADLLIFSGDISNRGKSEEFAIAHELLKDVCNSLHIKGLVCVPGNHDIIRDVPPRSAFLNFQHFRWEMESYVNGFEENPSYPDGMNYADFLSEVKVFPNLRTIVCGLNSATCIEDEKFGYRYGEITAGQLKKAEEKLQEMRKKYPNYLIIGTFHHNIFEPPYYFDYYNKEDEIQWIPPVKKQGLILKKCFENGMNLLLVGHSHVSSSYSIISHDYGEGKPLHILSAGLFSDRGVNPLEPQLTVNYIQYHIDLSGNISNILCRPYCLGLADGNWRMKKEYSLGLGVNVLM